jgi:hypothetical protein
MKWKYAAILASFLMVAMAFAVVTAAEDNSNVVPEMSALESYNLAKADYDRQVADGIVPYDTTVAPQDVFTYMDGPYLKYQDDGSPPGTQHMPWGSHYISDVMYAPPNNPGGWYSMDAIGGAGEFATGDTHESYIGDQNGNGIIEWISGFAYRPWGEDGIDNDGDGCVDEKTYGAWDGQVGCDRVPDQIQYVETGGLPDSGGEDGSLIALVDWYSAIQATEIYRAFVSPQWMAYQFRGFTNYPQIAGDFVSYYAYEGSNGVNSNPEMDSDQSDYYVGNIDARGFPARPPIDRACSAGRQLYMGITFLRDDGWVITSYYLYEYYDGNDWNDDGDTSDYSTAYYAIDPATGNCRSNAVNTGVYGYMPTTSGDLITPMYTSESSDRRDWDQSGSNSGYRKLYHTVSSTWAMKGPVYTSYTFTASVPAWGFGWWALYESTTYRTYPGKTFVGFQVYVGYSNGYYDTHMVLIADEDGNRHTYLPQYYVTKGYPGQALGGECLWITGREYYYDYAGLTFMPGPLEGDANGDGNHYDFAIQFFCPDETGGGGSFVVEPTSKYAKGLYVDPMPFIMQGNAYYYDAAGVAGGLVMAPMAATEYDTHDDADGDLSVGFNWYHKSYWVALTKPDFEIIPGSLEWVSSGDVQPGGTVIGTFDLLNVGGSDIKIKEDSGIENDKGFKLQGLSAKDKIGPDGTIEPLEAATFFFAMTVSAGSPIGPMDVKIIVSYGGITKEETVSLPIILKMMGDDLSCYRHRQNALRTMRAFDMDDDDGMLHNLEPGDLVNIDGSQMAPEDAILLLISMYEAGCGGGDDVEHAHSASASLTGHYGMGMEFWGFAPGQEEGNEGNGNGGLTGQDRKDVYGF